MSDDAPPPASGKFFADIRNAVFEFASDGMFVSDADGHYIDVNRRGCEMLGFSREELLAMTIHDLIEPEELLHDRPRLSELRAGSTLVRERRLRRKHAPPLCVEVSARALPDGHLLGIVRDIEERKRLESRLAASEGLYRSLFETSPDGIAVVDLEGRLRMVSPGAVALLGYDSEANLVGRYYGELVAPSSQDVARMTWESLPQVGKIEGIHVELLTRDGGQLLCEGSAALIRGGEGRPDSVLMLAREISAQARVEDELRRSEERYRLLFESNPEPMWVYDLETLAFLAVNTAAIERYGYSHAEFHRMTIADIRPTEDVPRLLANIAAVREGRDEAGPWRHRRKDGTVIDVEVTTHVIEFDGRRAELVHPLDITERLSSDSRVRQLTRLYALLSQVNHTIVRVTERDMLFQELCRVAVEHGEFRMAWIGLVDPATGDVLPVAHAGHEAGYLDVIRVRAADGPEGRGPSGTAILEGTLNTCEDVEADPRMEPWRTAALERGYRASAAVPFRINGKVGGVLNLYSDRPRAFATEERELLTELGQDISFALESMEAARRRREAEAALRASEARLEHLMAASPVTIYSLAVVGDRLEPTWMSANLHTVMGYESGEALRADWWSERVHPEDQARIFSGLPRLFTEGHLIHSYRFRGKDGEYRWIQDELRVLRDDAGQPMEVIGAWTDVSLQHKAEAERMALERELLHAQKLESLGVLAGGIAHDFNNLLMAISGHIELAMPQVPGSVGGHLDQAARAAQIATDLTRQMLAYTGKGRFVIKPIDLDNVVRENLQLLRASIAKSIVLDIQLATALPLIEADAGQVQQVTMNLITNAADAIGDRVGRITALTGVQTCDAATLRRSRVEVVPAAGDFVFLEVRDDGCGMESETLERLFEPFFTTRATGRGLGMSAILGIVRSHHGAIFVDSAPGQGTSFRVLFPACDRGVEHAPKHDTPQLGLATPQGGPLQGTVLIVDDEELMRQLGQHMLQRLGLNAIVVADGVEAVKLFTERSSAIDCVIVDLSMPIMDGLAVLTELQRIRPNIPVVLTSGYDEQESKRRLPEGGTVAFLQKPYTLNQLRVVLKEALSRSEK